MATTQPNDPLLQNNLGTTLAMQGKYSEAEACFRRALLLDPTLAEAHSNLGNILGLLGKLDQAVACYRQALRLRPDYRDARNNLAKALAAQSFTERVSLYELFEDIPRLKVIDVGADSIDGPPPYQPLVDAGQIELVGFEPDPERHRALSARKIPGATYMPYAIGDGSAGTLHIGQFPGMTSLLEPDMEILRHFHDVAPWGTVLKTIPVETKRLDDIAEAAMADYLKMDIQGGELGALRGAPKLLEHLLVVQVEVQFVPFYKDQPLFAELDQALRKAGFFFHRFMSLIKRVFAPMQIVNNCGKAHPSQQLWSDAVYVKKFTDFGRQDVISLLKIATILNDMYGSIDLSALALQHADRQANTQRLERYLTVLKPDWDVAGAVRSTDGSTLKSSA